MANIKSAQKQARKNLKRRQINLARSSSLKKAARRVLDALGDKNIEQAQELLRAAEAKFARAKSKGLLHRNTAAHKVSSLAKKVAAASRAK